MLTEFEYHSLNANTRAPIRNIQIDTRAKIVTSSSAIPLDVASDLGMKRLTRAPIGTFRLTRVPKL
jgi:hypothetical protein